MKQSLLILAAATTVAFAACNGGNKEGSYTQEQVDSIQKVKTDSVAAALKGQNDSTIAAQAAATARTADSIRVIDSIVAATQKASAATVTKKTTTVKKPHGNGSTTTTTTVVEPQAPVNPKASRFDDDAQDAAKKASADKKAERFKNR